MTRLLRSILVASTLVVGATPALAQKKVDRRTPAERAVDTYDPTLRGQRTSSDDRYDDRDDDRDDDDRYENDHGPGQHGRGHAYGQYRNKEEKEYHKQQDRLRKKGQKGDMCLDANRDGICDVAQRDRSVCRYDSRTGRCEYVETSSSARYPSRLPDMLSAVTAARGGRSAEAARWLGDQSLRVRTDRARNGRVSEASWYDPSGTLVQRWIDTNLDGRADAVQIFRYGQLVRTLRG